MGKLIGSKTVATIVTCTVFALFCALIGMGWFFLLEPQLGRSHLDIVIAAVLTGLAAVCARQIGGYRAAAKRAGEPTSLLREWQAYLFLLVISALGTLNAAFVLFESRAILRHDVGTVRTAYGTLRDNARATLPPTGYFEKVAQVNGLLVALHREINNPNGGNFCGIGPEAKLIILQIRALIPDYHVLAGSGPIRPCDQAKADKVFGAYKDMADEMLVGDRSFMGTKGPEKINFLTTLDRHYEQATRELKELEVSAGGFGGIQNIDRAKLYDARNLYNADRATYFSLAGKADKDVAEIGSLQSDDVGSYRTVFDLIVKRFFNGWTLFYLVIAFGLDFLTIYLLQTLNLRFSQARDAKRPEDEELERQFQTDPRFLWVKPPMPVVDR